MNIPSIIPTSLVKPGSSTQCVLQLRQPNSVNSRTRRMDEAAVQVTDNSMNECTQSAPIYWSRNSAYKMFNPLTGQVVERSPITPVPLSNYNIQLLQRCADPTNN